MTAALTHELLRALHVAHGFGTRSAVEPPGLLRPRQVHGSAVWWIEPGARPATVEADAVIAAAPGIAVGIATADCVPILLAARDGTLVGAVHAGWRGLARGVIPAAVGALASRAGDPDRLVAALGPHIGACCYEVDAPVLEALRPGFGDALLAALTPSRPGHQRLDLLQLCRTALLRAGLAPGAIGAIPDTCTRCDGGRFHSFRRDGPQAGRLVHWIATPPEA